GGWGHGGCGHHGFHGHSSVFIGGFFWDPFWYPGYYPYVAPYYYPYYGSYGYPYGPPPPYTDAPDYGEQEDDRNVARSEETEDPMRASYGLVQLRGVPD